MKMRFVSALSAVLILVMAVAVPAYADQYTNTIAIYKNNSQVAPFFESAYGYAVFPTVGKGAIGIGGAYGSGQVYVGGKVTGQAELAQMSIGLQLGGKAFSQMIFIEDKRAYDEFTGGSFEFDANAAAVAITASAQANVSTQGASASATAGPATGKQAAASYHKGMAVFTHAKGGLMADLSIGGQKFTFKPKE